MKIKKLFGVSIALFITVGLILLLTSTLWIGWMMEYEHNKTKYSIATVSFQCNKGAIEKREVWSKLGIAIFCEKNGVKHGVWQAWDGGYMHISGEYVEGIKHGTWDYFNANGEQWGKRVYENGKEDAGVIRLLSADSVVLNKKARKLYLKKSSKIYRTYNVRLGSQPVGHKQRAGDGRTPEGHYVLDSRIENSKYYKSIHLSYPNTEDQKQAQKGGLNPSGEIMLHGQPNGFGWAWRLLALWDWTDGCIAVNNQDMDELWNLIENGTSIEITP